MNYLNTTPEVFSIIIFVIAYFNHIAITAYLVLCQFSFNVTLLYINRDKQYEYSMWKKHCNVLTLLQKEISWILKYSTSDYSTRYFKFCQEGLFSSEARFCWFYDSTCFWIFNKYSWIQGKKLCILSLIIPFCIK